MMNNSTVGEVVVQTTSNRGFTPEEIAVRCADKIISVSPDAIPEVRMQADAFRGEIEKIVAFYMKECIKSHVTTLCNYLEQQGHSDMSSIVRKL